MKKKEKLEISIPIVIIFCLFIHPVMFKGTALLSYIYQYGIPIIYIFLHIRSVTKLSGKQAMIYGLLLFMILLSIMYPTLHATNEYSYLRVSTFVFRKIIVYIFIISILVRHYKYETSVEHFMYYFSIVQAIYVIGTMLLVFVPGIKEFWFSIFNEVIESETLLQSYGYTFRIGWQGFSGYEFTILCSISCMFLLYLYYGENAGIRITQHQFMIPYCLCFLGNMFYGRSGLVVSICTCIVGVVIWNKVNLVHLFRFAIVVVVFIYGIYALRNVGIFKEWYNWMSTPIINLFSKGSFDNASISATHDMVFNPEIKSFFFGDGYYEKDGYYYMRTDSGYMRSILFWGVFGSFICYLTTIISLWETKKRSVLLFVMLMGAFLVFEYKGHVYFDFILIMLAMTYVDTLKSYYTGVKYCYKRGVGEY